MTLGQHAPQHPRDARDEALIKARSKGESLQAVGQKASCTKPFPLGLAVVVVVFRIGHCNHSPQKKAAATVEKALGHVWHDSEVGDFVVLFEVSRVENGTKLSLN